MSTENPVRNAIYLEAPKVDALLFRNNCGMAIEGTSLCAKCAAPVRLNGQWIRYGVGNPGGSDLIGFTEVVITPEMVGRRVAVFTAVEVKRPDGGRSSERQKNFIKVIENAGGIAGVCDSVEKFKKLLQR